MHSKEFIRTIHTSQRPILHFNTYNNDNYPNSLLTFIKLLLFKHFCPYNSLYAVLVFVNQNVICKVKSFGLQNKTARRTSTF